MQSPHVPPDPKCRAPRVGASAIHNSLPKATCTTSPPTLRNTDLGGITCWCLVPYIRIATATQEIAHSKTLSATQTKKPALQKDLRAVANPPPHGLSNDGRFAVRSHPSEYLGSDRPPSLNPRTSTPCSKSPSTPRGLASLNGLVAGSSNSMLSVALSHECFIGHLLMLLFCWNLGFFDQRAL